MRIASVLMTAVLVATPIGQSFAAPVGVPSRFTQTSPASFATTPGVLGWMFRYAQKPDPKRIPYAYVSLSHNGALRDPEQAGVYLGFLAGSLRRAGPHADRLLLQLTGLPFEDQWIVVRALAYSGRPDWRSLMKRLEKHLPNHVDLAKAYLSGKLPDLQHIALENPTTSKWREVTNFITFHKEPTKDHQQTFENSPELLDVLWGLYFATGDEAPIERLVGFLAWSKDRDSVGRLTIGSMVRYTMADNASRSPALLAVLKHLAPRQNKKVAPVLAEVIVAAERVDTGYLRKDALAAIEQLKARGPQSMRNMAWWGQMGEGAVSLGCMGAALSGAGAAVGIPCVLGGALSSAGLKMISTPN